MAAPINPFKPLVEKVPPFFRNRYIATLLLFALWMVFFDHHDVLTQYRLRSTLGKLDAKEDYYQGEIERLKKEHERLSNSDEAVERFAREQHLLRRQNEDVYVIVKADDAAADE